MPGLAAPIKPAWWPSNRQAPQVRVRVRATGAETTVDAWDYDHAKHQLLEEDGRKALSLTEGR